MKAEALVVSHRVPACKTDNIWTQYQRRRQYPAWHRQQQQQWLSQRLLNQFNSANLSAASFSLIVEQIVSQSFSSWSKVFCTAWLMVFSMVWQTASIWFTHRHAWTETRSSWRGKSAPRWINKSSGNGDHDAFWPTATSCSRKGGADLANINQRAGQGRTRCGSYGGKSNESAVTWLPVVVRGTVVYKPGLPLSAHTCAPLLLLLLLEITRFALR